MEKRMYLDRKFPVGSKVKRSAFIDCFKKQIEEIPNLTVIESEPVTPQSIPPYFRITAIGPNGANWVRGAESFFEAI
jgi:hypothetical protein